MTPTRERPWLIGCGLVAAIGAACAEPANGPSTGSIEVTAVTTGSGTDPDGYLVALDNGPAKAFGPNGTLVYGGVPTGDHQLMFTGLAFRCTLTGDAARDIVVREGETGAATFIVACDPASGNLVIRTRSSGADIDPSGYRVLLDGAPVLDVGTSGTAETTILAGDHTVTLDGVTLNCVVESENPRTVRVAADADIVVSFAIDCSPADPAGPGGEIAFITSRFGDEFSREVVLANADGTALRKLLAARGPIAWAPRGTAVAIADDPNILIGSTVDAQTFVPETVIQRDDRTGVYGLSWSPDASRLAISEVPPDGSGCGWIVGRSLDQSEDRFIVATSNCLSVTDKGNPAWAPDGSSIAVWDVTFTDSDDRIEGLWLVNPELEDQELRGLPAFPGITPAWSPDGSRMAYADSSASTSEYDLFTARPDGTDPVRLTFSPGDDGYPAWSPDGTRIAFVSHRDGNAEIYVVNADGSDPARITNHPATDTMPAWRP